MRWLRRFLRIGGALESPNAVTSSIGKILNIVSEISGERDSIIDRYDNDSLSMAAVGALRLVEAEEPLREYLSTLDYELLLKIEAVMFFGKFVGQDLNEKYEMCVNMGQSREDIVDLILGSAASCENYFKHALQQAEAKGLDLDRL